MMLTMVLAAVGVDVKYFAYVLPADWLLCVSALPHPLAVCCCSERLRTAVNVHGDGCTAVIVARLCALADESNIIQEAFEANEQDSNERRGTHYKYARVAAKTGDS
jgi:Na+/H+-dicarboxylate symporter